MDKQISDLDSLLRDVKSSQGSVMKRFDQLMSSESDEKQEACNCNCRTEELQKDISTLQTSSEELNSKLIEKGQKQLKITEDVNNLQSRLEHIETLLLSKATYDSKLHETTLESKNKDMVTPTKPVVQESGITEEKASEQYISARPNTNTADVSRKASVEANDTKETKHRSEKPPERNKPKSDKNHAPVWKPNFRNQKQQKVKQDMKRVYSGEVHWKSIAQNELDISRSLFQQLEGVHSIICLDISESMCEGNAWSQAHTFLTDYLKGLEEMSKLPDLKTEYVALVTFGHETKVQMRYTDRHSEVQTLIDNLKLGGPSPMFGGFLFALAPAWCSCHQIEKLRNGVHVATKMIMITDGKPTESELIAGPDIADSSKVDDTKAEILQELESSLRNRMDVFFVPVGASDTIFLRTMVTISDGMMLNYSSGRRFARRQYLSTQLLDPLGLHTEDLTRGSDSDFSDDDKISAKDMRNIQERGRKMLENPAVKVVSVNSSNMYCESNNENLPALGSRVRRGPDWRYDLQDSNGPGTVIGHTDVGEGVLVEWDSNSFKQVYRYSLQGYDVLLVDEPRVLRPGQIIAVGCEVEPGKDWKSSERKKQRGVVLRLNGRFKQALVRWNNGRRGEYSYGDGGLMEIQLKSAFQKRGVTQNGQAADRTSSIIDNARRQGLSSNGMDNGPSLHISTNNIDTSRSLNSASPGADYPRIVETIESYAARTKENKNENNFAPDFELLQ